jgi:CheY-like chemotaxis protein
VPAGLDVLLVEDDREATEMMTVVLSDRGARVRTRRTTTARCGAAAGLARRAGQRHRPAGRDGYELVRRVRELRGERTPPLPVDRAHRLRAARGPHKTLDAGFDLHLGKPLKPHLLLEAIARCRDARRPRRTRG